MGLIDIVRTKSTTWTYAEIRADRTPQGLVRDLILPGQFYINVTLRSFRIPNLKVLFSKFFGTVHSYCEIQSGAGDISQMQTITTPQQLQSADPSHVDRTLIQNIPLLGPVPFVGGNFLIEIGLFAMKESDLTGPYLNLLGSVATKAGISSVGNALQLAQPVLDGINSIVDTTAAGLQIGIYKQFVQPDVPQQGYYAVIAATMGTVDTSNLAIDNNQRLVLFDTRKEIEQPYIVFTIERLTARTDWRELPDVKATYAAIHSAQLLKDKTKIEDALTAFKVMVASSLDLLDDDQDKIIAGVDHEVTKFLTILAGGGNPKPTPIQNIL